MDLYPVWCMAFTGSTRRGSYHKSFCQIYSWKLSDLFQIYHWQLTNIWYSSTILVLMLLECQPEATLLNLAPEEYSSGLQRAPSVGDDTRCMHYLKEMNFSRLESVRRHIYVFSIKTISSRLGSSYSLSKNKDCRLLIEDGVNILYKCGLQCFTYVSELDVRFCRWGTNQTLPSNSHCTEPGITYLSSQCT
jgi:hypothetical protein